MSRKKPPAAPGDSSRFAAALSCLREIHHNLSQENRLLRADPGRQVTQEFQRVTELEQQVARLELDRSALAARLEELENKAGGGSQEDLLANLYVAGYHLHRAGDLQAVLISVKEILLNLVGAETFAVYLLDGDGRMLTQVADQSNASPPMRRIPLNEGIMGVVAKTGIAYFDGERQHGDFHNPVACVPLMAEDHLLGVIQIHRLFSQKKNLAPQDHEIFTLLAETAGTAMLSALLRHRYLRGKRALAASWEDLLGGAVTAANEPPAVQPLAEGDDSPAEGRRA